MLNRGFLSSMIRNFIGLTAVGGLTLGTIAPAPGTPGNSPEPEPATESSWRLLPGISYENITLFPVVSSAGADTSMFLTLDEGFASGEVVVTEQGSGGMFRRERSTGTEAQLSDGVAHVYDRGCVGAPTATVSLIESAVLINRSKL
jgi:hypothetical protein